MSRIASSLARTFLALAAACSIALGASAAMADDKRTVSVSATGAVSAVPDIVNVTVGVQTLANTARQALADNTEAMRRVVEALKEQGLEARDIQTTSFSVQPSFEYPQDGRPRLVGYQVVNAVAIRVRAVAKLGEILDVVVRTGSNQVSGVEFTVSKAEELKDEARAVAFTNARRMAEVYAKAAGATLGPVVRIEETNVQFAPVATFRAELSAAKPAPIEAGEQSVSVSVAVTWSLE